MPTDKKKHEKYEMMCTNFGKGVQKYEKIQIFQFQKKFKIFLLFTTIEKFAFFIQHLFLFHHSFLASFWIIRLNVDRCVNISPHFLDYFDP